MADTGTVAQCRMYTLPPTHKNSRLASPIPLVTHWGGRKLSTYQFLFWEMTVTVHCTVQCVHCMGHRPCWVIFFGGGGEGGDLPIPDDTVSYGTGTTGVLELKAG